MGKQFCPISPKQYGLARDVGFSPDDLRGATYLFYKKNRDEIKGPIKDEFALVSPRLLEAIQRESKEEVVFDTKEIFFRQARFVMRELAKQSNDDFTYLAYIQEEEAKNAQRQEKKQHDNTKGRAARRLVQNTSAASGTDRQAPAPVGTVRTDSDTNGKPRIVPAVVELPKLARTEIKYPNNEVAVNDRPLRNDDIFAMIEEAKANGEI